MREIIFDLLSKYGEYRVVCQFGHHSFVNYAWWGYLQKKHTYKTFWGKKKERWVELDRCWWSKEITSLEQLEKNANKLYDDFVEAPIRRVERVMAL